MRPELPRSNAPRDEGCTNSWQSQGRKTLRSVGVRSQLQPAHEQKRCSLCSQSHSSKDGSGLGSIPADDR